MLVLVFLRRDVVVIFDRVDTQTDASRVLSVDGAVTSVSAADGAGTRGVRIERSGGPVTVRFGEDAFGASVEDASGTVTLGAGVEALPLFAP